MILFERKGKVIPKKKKKKEKKKKKKKAQIQKMLENQQNLYEEYGGCQYQKNSREYGRVCKVEDSHRDKTERCA